MKNCFDCSDDEGGPGIIRTNYADSDCPEREKNPIVFVVADIRVVPKLLLPMVMLNAVTSLGSNVRLDAPVQVETVAPPLQR